MKIIITNSPNWVRLDYNDIQAPAITSISRVIRKASVKHLKLATGNAYVEVQYVDGEIEQFDSELFEGYHDNVELYEALALFM